MPSFRLLALPAFAVALAAPIAARAQSADSASAVSVEYDKDSDSSTVTLVVPFSGKAPKGKVFGGKGKPEFSWTVGFVGAGQGVIAPSIVTSVFVFHESMPANYYNAHIKQLGGIERLDLVIDGQAVPPVVMPPVIGTARMDERTSRVSLDRTYAALFSPALLLRIAQAAEVEGRLHGRGFVIDETARQSLRELARHLAPATDVAVQSGGR